MFHPWLLLCALLPLCAAGVHFRVPRAPPARFRSLDAESKSLFGADGLYYDPDGTLEEFFDEEVTELTLAGPSFCVFSRIIVQELPYVKSFVKHYVGLGVEKFYFVSNMHEQQAIIAEFLNDLAADVRVPIALHSVHVSDADAALNDMELFRRVNEDFVIGVDIDEYWMLPDGITSFKGLVEAHPAATEYRVQWIMVPNDDIDRSEARHYLGFRGANGKWMAKRNTLQQVAVTPHKPLFIEEFVAHEAMFDAGELIHFWGRSFLDQLTKGLGQQLHNRASENLKVVRRMTSEGSVPERLRMLAFLMNLDKNMTVNVDADLLTINHSLEKDIAAEFLDVNITQVGEEVGKMHHVYAEFKKHLANIMSSEEYPSYPHQGFEDIAPWLEQVDDSMRH